MNAPPNDTATAPDGTVNPAGNTTDTVPPATNAPTAVAVNPTVHDAPVAEPDCGTPTNDTPVTTPAEMTTSLSAAAGVVSELVATVNPALAYVFAAGFVIPDNVTCTAALFATEQPPPVNVTVTV